MSGRVRIRRAALAAFVIAAPLAVTAAAAAGLDGAAGSPAIAIQLAAAALALVPLALACGERLLGAWVIATGGDPVARRASDPAAAAPGDAPPLTVPLTVIVIPVCHEDPRAVFAGLRAMVGDLAGRGALAGFEVFVLSDSTDPAVAAEERRQWRAARRDLGPAVRVHYRRRGQPSGRKPGNVADFCRRWGARYRYMILLDADSLMGGEVMIELVRRMEASPRTGLLQVPVHFVGGQTLFARLLQFRAGVEADVYIAGAGAWQASGYHYLGHNAIVRLADFARLCRLPHLPGREPLGGEIFSHDLVESGLLRRARLEVWQAAGLRSYEELPPTLIDYVKRDRRWCQGNLQHLRLLVAPGFDAMSRILFLKSAATFLTGPIWALLALATAVVLARDPGAADAALAVQAPAALALWLVPRAVAVALSAGRPRASAAGLAAGLVVELAAALVIAPVLAAAFTGFLIGTALRRPVGWPAQARVGHEVSLGEAVRVHGWHALVGLGCAGFALARGPSLTAAALLVFVAAPLLAAIPFTVLTSRTRPARAARRAGLFVTAEELATPVIVSRRERELARCAAADEPGGPGDPGPDPEAAAPPPAPLAMPIASLTRWSR
ncbi:MAG TPA: glucans biosynthesis glucosyltransferase MdoH [Kofleriaceae bacterium]|nr:glucans biosynthesis glucosyltransferase MdoH [Kofleriaceae bacterium]